MKIEKITKIPQPSGRWSVTAYLDRKIDWDKLAQKRDVEYNPDVGDAYPKIRTSAATICFKRQSIQIMNPFEQDISTLLHFAMTRLDGRFTSKSWLEFKLYWKKEYRELDYIEKMLIGKKAN